MFFWVHNISEDPSYWVVHIIVLQFLVADLESHVCAYLNKNRSVETIMYQTIGTADFDIVMSWHDMHQCAPVVVKVRRKGFFNHGDGWWSDQGGRERNGWEEMKSIGR
jgi:hypothetical protein